MRNVRARGKIPKKEWPKIAARYRSGDTFTEIARSYHCTAPAIRYIVNRVPNREIRKAVERDTQNKIALLAPLVDARRLGRSYKKETRVLGRYPRSNFASEPSVKEVWDRINIDISTFLAAVESLSMDSSEDNYQSLLDATDRLLWGSARTRLELERILASNKREEGGRRVSG